MILIFIRYSDVNIPPRLSWDMKERLSSANRLAKPAPGLRSTQYRVSSIRDEITLQVGVAKTSAFKLY